MHYPGIVGRKQEHNIYIAILHDLGGRDVSRCGSVYINQSKVVRLQIFVEKSGSRYKVKPDHGHFLPRTDSHTRARKTISNQAQKGQYLEYSQ